MGLNDNTRHINTALTEANRIKQEKEAERRKKQQEKENKSRLEKDIKKALETEFYNYFALYGSSYITEFYSIERKNKILHDIIKTHGKTIKTYFINKNTGKTEQEIIKYKNKEEIKEIFNRYYYKILKEQHQIFKNNEKYLIQKAQEEAEQQQEKENKINFWNILEATGSILYKIIIFIILFIITIVTAAIKSSK